jgi:uncharacterized membrane protein
MYSVWKQAPFLQLLLPFLLGIVLYHFLPNAPVYLGFVLVAFLLGVYIFIQWRLHKKKRYP